MFAKAARKMLIKFIPKILLLFILGTSSNLARHDVYGKTNENLVPRLTKNTTSVAI
jgi:hypothetical protein